MRKEKEIELTPRLAAVARLVPEGGVLADVGTDHAYLPVALLRQGRISGAIATDVRPGPLDHARRTAQAYGVTEQMQFRLCDGLTLVKPGECSCIAIAGMGGETIVHILQDARWTRDNVRLILQPQSTQSVLRRFLAENGYCIRSERVAREGDRWYPVLEVTGGEMPALSPGEQLAGRPSDWIDQPERQGYLAWLQQGLRRQLSGLRQSAKPGDALRCSELEQTLAELERMSQEPGGDCSVHN